MTTNVQSEYERRLLELNMSTLWTEIPTWDLGPLENKDRHSSQS